MKKVITLIIILIVSISKAQTPCTLIFNKGMTVEKGFVGGGIQVTLPANYRCYIYGDRIIVGIEKFDSIAQYKAIEEVLLKKYTKKLCQRLTGTDENSGDTEISYEISNSEIFKHCEVVYFYYDSMMSSNSIESSWNYLSDGEHTILIVANGEVTFQKKIKLQDGLLVFN
ncbi:MAG: hypothetical protein KA210_00110 [Bacteroidia bacterium]|nr:hypothetical protein [Bacteroidia bacterium]